VDISVSKTITTFTCHLISCPVKFIVYHSASFIPCSMGQGQAVFSSASSHSAQNIARWYCSINIFAESNFHFFNTIIFSNRWKHEFKTWISNKRSMNWSVQMQRHSMKGSNLSASPTPTVSHIVGLFSGNAHTMWYFTWRWTVQTT
jgi:hypothetical protein